MAPTNEEKNKNFRVAIGLPEGEEWSAEKLAAVKAHAKQVAASRSPEQVLRNRYLAIKYRMEAYAATSEQEIKKPIPLETFLQEYLDVFDISFRKFAGAIHMNDSNLKKYLSGDRKFNADLARRFGYFFQTSPVTWMKVYQLNDLVELLKEPEASGYKKNDNAKLADLIKAGAGKHPVFLGGSRAVKGKIKAEKK